MGKKIIDVWKHPHISYRKAFLLATVLTLFLVATAFSLFAAYIAPKMQKEMKVNFLNTIEAEQVVEEVKEMERQEEIRPERAPSRERGRGSGKGGQHGSHEDRPRRSDVKPTNEKAKAGEAGTTAKSPIGSDTGDGLKGDAGQGVGRGEGTGYGNSETQGAGIGEGDEDGKGVGDPGSFDPNGYRNRLQANAQNQYPRAALQREIEGTVTLLITFDANGNVIDVQAESGHSVLQKAAIQMAWQVGGALNTTGQTKQARIHVQFQLPEY